jgi:nucleotide-binding universal stress UspA family protein
MIRRILLAVDDSPAALAAARLAVQLAAGWHAEVRAVSVIADGVVDEHLRGGPDMAEPEEVGRRRERSAGSLLRHVARLAEQAGAWCETVQLTGDPARQVLDQARSWPADLIVVGRSDLPGPGQPYVGSHTRRVLEFAGQPVLVVPNPRTA